jgi:hypothetical protein
MSWQSQNNFPGNLGKWQALEKKALEMNPFCVIFNISAAGGAMWLSLWTKT